MGIVIPVNSGGGSTDLTAVYSRLDSLEGTLYEVTYKQTIDISSATAGSISFPTGATLEETTLLAYGNCILLQEDSSGNVLQELVYNSSSETIDSTLDSSGNWTVTETYSTSTVSLVFRVQVSAKNYGTWSDTDLENVLDVTASFSDGGSSSSVTTIYTGDGTIIDEDRTITVYSSDISDRKELTLVATDVDGNTTALQMSPNIIDFGGYNSATVSIGSINGTRDTYTSTGALIMDDSQVILRSGTYSQSQSRITAETSLYVTDNRGIQIYDGQNSIGLGYNADYSSAGITQYGDRWISDVGYQATVLGGQVLNDNIQNPDSFEDGYVVTWDDTNSQYVLATVAVDNIYNTDGSFDVVSGVRTFTLENNAKFLIDGYDGTDEDSIIYPSFSVGGGATYLGVSYLKDDGQGGFESDGERSLAISSSGIVLTDSNSSVGLVGAGNYSTNATANTYIQKAYADAYLAGSSIGFTVGSGVDGYAVVWDNTNTQWILSEVSSDNIYTVDGSWRGARTIEALYDSTSTTEGELYIYAYDTGDGADWEYRSTLRLYAQQSYLRHEYDENGDGSSILKADIVLGSSGIQVVNTINNQGMKYESTPTDYQDLTLVPKEYVDDLVFNGTLTTDRTVTMSSAVLDIRSKWGTEGGRLLFDDGYYQFGYISGDVWSHYFYYNVDTSDRIEVAGGLRGTAYSTPSNNNDYVQKKYVDDSVSGLAGFASQTLSSDVNIDGSETYDIRFGADASDGTTGDDHRIDTFGVYAENVLTFEAGAQAGDRFSFAMLPTANLMQIGSFNSSSQLTGYQWGNSDISMYYQGTEIVDYTTTLMDIKTGLTVSGGQTINFNTISSRGTTTVWGNTYLYGYDSSSLGSAEVRVFEDEVQISSYDSTGSSFDIFVNADENDYLRLGYTPNAGSFSGIEIGTSSVTINTDIALSNAKTISIDSSTSGDDWRIYASSSSEVLNIDYYDGTSTTNLFSLGSAGDLTLVGSLSLGNNETISMATNVAGDEWRWYSGSSSGNLQLDHYDDSTGSTTNYFSFRTGSNSLVLQAGDVNINNGNLDVSGTITGTFLGTLPAYSKTGSGTNLPSSASGEQIMTLTTEQVTNTTYYTSATNGVTVVEAGTYLVSFNMIIDDDGATGDFRGCVEAYIKVNNTAIEQSKIKAYIREQSNGTGLSNTCVIEASAGHRIEIAGIQDGNDGSSSTTVDVSQGETSLNIVKIG